jgi:hypothetical protein
MKNITEEVNNNLELQVIESVQILTFNFDEIKESLKNKTEKFKNLVVTDENLKDMEKEHKTIVSLRTSIEAFRKSEKKKMEEPIKAFEKQIIELKNIVASVEDPITDQLHKYDLDRVNKASKLINEEAKEYSLQIGLREEYLFDFIIPKELTNRGATKAKTLKAIHELVDALLLKQNNEDTAKMLQQQKQELISQLCVTSSDLYSLNTTVQPHDLERLTQDTPIAEIPELIKNYCQKRAEIERQAMQVAQQVKPEITTTSLEKPIEVKTNDKKYNLAIAIMNVTEQQEQQLLEFISRLTDDYKLVKKSEVKEV